MPRPRNTTEFARITGADTAKPKRYAGRADPVVDAIGAPPDRLTNQQRVIWAEFVDDLPWLRRSDRTILELSCRLAARMETDPDMGIAALAQLRLCLSSMGATPVDRSKVTMPSDNEPDPADEFLN